ARSASDNGDSHGWHHSRFICALTMSEPRVFILGAGRAGSAIATALHAAGVVVAGVHGRRLPPEWAQGAPPPFPFSTGTIPTGALGANVVLVAVRDSQINEALMEIMHAGLAPGSVVLHASGSAEPSAAAALRGE